MEPLILNIFLSFIVGGVWITLTTYLAERFGSNIGGIIGGLPSTSLIALLFIGLNQGVETAIQTTTVMPLTNSFSSVFLAIFVLLGQRSFWRGYLGGMTIWAACAAVVALYPLANFWLSLAVAGIVFATANISIRHMVKTSFQKIAVQYTPLRILFRALFAGFIIAFAVFMSKVAGPVFGGIFAMFPALFTSTLFILYYSGGLHSVRLITKPLVLSSAINTTTFVVTVRYLMAAFGLLWGIIAAFGISIVTAALVYKFVLQQR